MIYKRSVQTFCKKEQIWCDIFIALIIDALCWLAGKVNRVQRNAVYTPEFTRVARL